MTTGPSLMEIKEISEENYIHVIEDNQKLKETISKITKENNEQKNSIKKIKDNVIEKKEEFEKRLEYFKSNNFYVIA